METKNDFLKDLELLKDIYNKLDEGNKVKLEEALQIIITKFRYRINKVQ